MSLDTNPALDTETREAIDIDRTKGDFVFPRSTSSTPAPA
jgi:hypothetical protein